MPCSAYDDDGKLVMLIAGAGEKIGQARAEAAVGHPKTRFIVACLCERPQRGIADASECENGRTQTLVLYRPGEPGYAEAERINRSSRRRRQRASRTSARRRKH